MKIDLKTLITEELSKQRKVFHSEDDLKFSLGYLIKKKYDKCEIRLEKPVEIEMINREGELIKSRAAIDIVIIDGNNNQIPIEIKYKTKSLVKDKIAKEPKPFKVENELYDLSNQGASDLGRFNFRKDIFRIEKFIENGLNKAEYGFCLIITNDKDYWTEAKETLIKN